MGSHSPALSKIGPAPKKKPRTPCNLNNFIAALMADFEFGSHWWFDLTTSEGIATVQPAIPNLDIGSYVQKPDNSQKNDVGIQFTC